MKSYDYRSNDAFLDVVDVLIAASLENQCRQYQLPS